MNEVCPKCGSPNFSVARDMLGTRECSKCNRTWLPEKPPIKLPPVDPLLELKELKIAVVELLKITPAGTALLLPLHAQWVLSRVVGEVGHILPERPKESRE